MIEVSFVLLSLFLNLKDSYSDLSKAAIRPQVGMNRLRKRVIFNEKNFVKFAPFIELTAHKHGLDPKLVKAMIVVESKFNPKAGSNKGAQGLMQLMPATALEVGVKNLKDPYQNIRGGVKYFKRMLKMFDYDVSLALAAYNAGPGRVIQYSGIPPYIETQGYVRKVLFAHERL